MKTKNLLTLVVLTVILTVSVNAQNITIQYAISPTATFIHSNETSYNGDSTELIIKLTGNNECGWNIVYSDGKINHTLHITESPYVLTVSPTSTTIYTLISVNNNNCYGNIIGGPFPNSGEVIVTKNYLPKIDPVD